MMSENKGKKSQKRGLLSVGACRFGLGIEIVERIVDTACFSERETNTFCQWFHYYYVTDLRNFDLFRSSEGGRAEVKSRYRALSCMVGV